VLRAAKVGEVFRLYITAQTSMIGVVLMQEEDGNEFTVANVSRRLLDAETRYIYIKKLCLSLYYVCTKFQHYMLSSACTIVCHHDVIKYMLHKPILSGRVGKWAYSLVEYDLMYEPFACNEGQVVADFIVDHSVNASDDACLVEASLWKLFIDGSVCNKGHGVSCVIVSPNGAVVDLFVRLEFACTNNQVEYEALLCGLEYLRDKGGKKH
jgi:hypothetical protein